MQLPTFNSERFKSIKPRYIVASLVILLLLIGGAIGLYLVSRPQEIRQQAAGYASCAGGVAHDARACAGFRQPVLCQNGAFQDLPDCTAAQFCEGGVCKLSSTSTPPPPVATPVASPPGGGSCQPLTAACSDTSPCCEGGVCQGAGGNRRCEQQVVGQCGTGVCGGTNGWLGFRCNNLTNGQCLENPQTFSSYGAAASYAGGCGQVDEVCVGGTNNRKLCGSFHIFNSSCGGVGGPDPTPTTNPSPSASPRVTPTPVVSPTPGVTPTPEVTPTPAVTPTPEVSPTPGVSPSPTPIVCGSTCASTAECPQDHTCNTGVCQLTACVNGQPCSADQCRVTACGGSCASTAECPNDHICNGGVCQLNACVNNGASCSSDLCRITACGSSCSSNTDCPNDHQCNGGVCKLNACINGATCDDNQCNVVNTNPSPVASPVLGCNDACVNNSDCKSSTQICVDTTNGRRCRLETNITSDTCTPAGQAAAPQTPAQPQQPAALPVAGSADVLKAMAVGALAIILGIVGFLAL